MYNIAVCDDQIISAQNIKTCIQNYQSAHRTSFDIHIFSSGPELLNCKKIFDLIFLDIEMPNMDGIETAKKIRLFDKNAALVYVTGYSSYAIKSFAVHPFDFIIKPFRQEHIFNVVNEFIEYISQKSPLPMVELKGITGVISLCIDDIIAFEYVQNRRLKLHIFERVYDIKGSITEILQMFPEDSFTSPHKSFIINLKYVKRLYDYTILMQNELIIPVAQKRLKEFQINLNNYMHKYLIQE